MSANQDRCPRCGSAHRFTPGRPPVCSNCWQEVPSRLRRAVARLDARTQRKWALGRQNVDPAPRKKRTPRSRRGLAAPAALAAAPPRLSFLAASPEPPAGTASAPVAAAERPTRMAAAPPPEMRRQQARIRRAALIARQLGDRDLPFEFVDFMAVEDAAATIGFEAAVEAVAQRESRPPTEIEEAWNTAVARIASDDRCRYVDALRPYIERIEAELG